MSVPVARIRVLLVAFSAVLGVALATPAAQADSLALGGAGCGNEQLEQPFAPFGDYNWYTLVPGGSFESGGPAWNTTGGAQLVADQEPWGTGVQAMSLPPGSSTTSPATCVSLDSPTMRFFATSSGDPSSTLQVNVVFEPIPGEIESLPVGTVSAPGTWEPSSAFPIVANLLSALGGDYGVVEFQFVPQGNATWEIDDVYVDPWSKG
jgi:hypothetical protein